MIAMLRGVVFEKTTESIILDVGGVGYEVWIPISTYERVPPEGGEFKVFIEHVVREDDERLYGFATHAERDAFRLLLCVKGVGPKGAISVLSAMRVEELSKAISEGDAARIARAQGIGKKTAQQIIFDLRAKLHIPGGALAPEKGSAASDAIRALEALGFSNEDAHRRVESAANKLSGNASVEELIKAALG